MSDIEKFGKNLDKKPSTKRDGPSSIPSGFIPRYGRDVSRSRDSGTNPKEQDKLTKPTTVEGVQETKRGDRSVVDNSDKQPLRDQSREISPPAKVKAEALFEHLNGPQQLCDAYDTKREAYAQQVAEKHGVSVTEYNELCQQRIEKLTEESSTWSRCRPQILEKILDEGRFKSVFETGQAGGKMAGKDHDYMERRAKKEEMMFGYPSGSVPSDRPIYGYLSPHPDGRDHTSNQGLDAFGSAAVHFKESIRCRASFTMRDSFKASNGGTEANLCPSPLENPTGRSYFYNKDLLEVHSFEQLERCVEAQYHGGVTTKDIKEVVFHHEEPSEKLKQQLNNNNIPYRQA